MNASVLSAEQLRTDLFLSTARLQAKHCESTIPVLHLCQHVLCFAGMAVD